MRNESETNIMDTFGQFRPIRDHIFKTVSPKLYFLFFVLGYILSKNICKLRHKLKNAKFTWS